MSRKKLVLCDACGREVDTFGRLFACALRVRVWHWRGGWLFPLDVCDECRQGLREWLRQRRAERLAK